MGEPSGYLIPRRYWEWVADPWILRAAAWFVVGLIALGRYETARAWMRDIADTPPGVARPAAGSHGYTQIDFGGQWVMGRMVATGRGKQLYHRQVQWQVVRAGFPEADETPAQRHETLLPAHLRTRARTADDVGHDADNLMFCFMGADPPEWQAVGGAAAALLAADPTGNPLAALAHAAAAGRAVTPGVVERVTEPAVGGPLYPPVHALFYAPLGLLDSPGRAYHVFQVVGLGFAFLAGAGLSALTGWRVWWSAGTAAVLLFPGCGSALELGQNPTASLAVAAWGWALAARGRDFSGGVVWGLFAFKPVWALAFVLVPLLQRRWRFLAGMVGTGVALGAATFPVVGVEAWFHWLRVGKEAAALYNVHESWINLSRDLQGLPRRLLLDFGKPEGDRDSAAVTRVCWALWAAVFAPTVLVYLARGGRRPVGVGAAFLFFGAFLTCYRFMYYDVLLALMGFAALAGEPGRLLRTRVFAFRPGPPADPFGPPPARPRPGPPAVGYLNSVPLTLLFALWLWENVLLPLDVRTTGFVGAWGRVRPDGATGPAVVRLDLSLAFAWDTVLVLLAWAWCGARLLWRAEGAENSAPLVLPAGGAAPLK